MKIKTYAGLILGLLSSSYSFAQNEETISSINIVGGEFVTAEAYPWVAQLVNDEQEHICAGTVIAPQWILTAGHCSDGFGGLIDLPTKAIINTIHYTQLDTNSEEIGIEAIFVHEGFDINSPFNDIALIKLSSPTTIDPIIYDGKFNTISNISDNDVTTVLGWGSTNEDGDISYILKQAEPKVLFNDEMIIYAGYLEGETPAGAGAGDSGGPMIIKENGTWNQVGVISGGSEIITTTDSPGRYTKIFHYKDWIKSIIENNVSINENQFPIAISVYQDHIRLDGHLEKNGTYEIYDITGKTLQSGHTSSTITRTQQMMGLVFLKLQTKEKSKVFKLLL